METAGSLKSDWRELPSSAMDESSPPAKRPNQSAILSALSNFTIRKFQYNYNAVNVALIFIKPVYEISTTIDSLFKCVVFIGSIVGQLTMGYAGDRWGRRRAMMFTTLLVVVGALGSALTPWGSGADIYAILIFWRFVIGFGVGGKYPLSATMRSEGTDSASQHTSTEVARGFFWQTPGTVVPYLVGMLLCAIYGQISGNGDVTKEDASVQFRVVLACGALPSVVSLLLLMREPESEAFSQSTAHNPLRTAMEHPELWTLVIGTGVTWFLFDVVIYGCTLNQTTIMTHVFGEAESNFDKLWQNAVVNSIAIVGIVVGIAMLERMGTKPLQVWGFAFMAIAAAALALAFASGASSGLQFALYALLVALLNWGPNVSTYVLPTEVYPPAVRSSFFGISAAMGKAGATLGSFGFKEVEAAIKLPWLFGIIAILSLVGMAVSHIFIEPFGSGSCCGATQERAKNSSDDRAGLLNSATVGIE